MTVAVPRSGRADDEISRVRIEVTGGDSNRPVDNASVYVRYYADAKKQKGKLSELDLKTNQEGVARSNVPQGKVQVQVVAPGWMLYGEWHDVTEAEQTIQIHLVRPPKPHP